MSRRCLSYLKSSVVMIESFKHKGLAELHEDGSTSRIDQRLHSRIIERLDALDAATAPSDLIIPGFDFHALRGHKPTRYTVHINGPWCITFSFDGTDVVAVDLEQYH